MLDVSCGGARLVMDDAAGPAESRPGVGTRVVLHVDKLPLVAAEVVQRTDVALHLRFVFADADQAQAMEAAVTGLTRRAAA